MAGRPRTPVGSWGDISARQTNTGAWEARARYRHRTGRLARVWARANSKTAAIARLRSKLQNLTVDANNADINHTTTITDLCTRWLETKTNLRRQSIDDYRQTIDGNITPAIGTITLEETTAGVLAGFLDSLSAGNRTRARSILAQALDLAVSYDAIQTNWIRQLPQPKRSAGPIRVLTPPQLVELRRGVEAWQAGHINESGHPTTKIDHRSAGRAHDLLWFVDLLLATGCRPGELAACRWKDINLDATPPTLTVTGTMVWVKGAGVIRQDQTKTSMERTLGLPPYAVRTLATIRSRDIFLEPDDPVFLSATGGFRDPVSIRKQWRAARKAAGRGNTDKFAWVEFRTMRKTVATVIDRAASDSDAAAQLGHTSTAMTKRHYIAAKARTTPDLTDILEQFCHDQPKQSGG